jgi:hypothetical protein
MKLQVQMCAGEEPKYVDALISQPRTQKPSKILIEDPWIYHKKKANK